MAKIPRDVATEDSIELTLSREDARALRDLLRERFPDLKFEVARTDATAFRHLLVERQDLIERLIAQLEGRLATVTP
jgi:hypothetical protein